MSDAVFGPITEPNDVDDAVLATLKQYMPTYLRFQERRQLAKGHAEFTPDSLPEIASWRSADTMEERFPEQAIPAVQVMMTADTDLETRGDNGAGLFKGTVDILVSSTEPEPARKLASIYAFAMGLLLHQHAGLDGSITVEGFGWEKVGVPAVAKPMERWLALGSIDINILVGNVYQPLGGPQTPIESVPPAEPTVVTTDLILEPKARP